MAPRALLAAAGLALAACAPPPPQEPDLFGAPLRALYADTAAEIQRRGGLRTAKAPKDAPITVESLVQNFERIAFYTEYSREGRRTFGTSRIPLTRWERPVRVGVIFGESVSPRQRAADLAEVRKLLTRYRRLTGLDFRYVPDGETEMMVLVLDRLEQLIIADLIEEDGLLPRAVAADLRASRPSELCSAFVFGPGDDGGIGVAVALIKAEHSGLLRRSCFHEEMTQALGLLNDSPDARPSIFNDDEEFALLTLHDEILLRMLYDPRLTPGMEAEEARLLLPRIARDAAAASGLRLN